jgi:oxalate---CoA ligase
MTMDKPLDAEKVSATIGALWASILLTEEPTIDANFYEDGGDSLMALTFSRQIADDLGVTISPMLFMTADNFGEIVGTVVRQAELSSG